MQISVKLQDIHTYPLYMTISMVAMAVLAVAIAVYVIIKRYKPVKVENKSINSADIQKKYLSMLDELLYLYNNKKITNRKAHIKLSEIIRRFAYEATGIKVQNLTLKEIEMMNMPVVSDIVRACYEPEFAADSLGDVAGSVDKAKGVIEKWKSDIL